MPIISSGVVRGSSDPVRADAREPGMPTSIPFSTFINSDAVLSNGAAAILVPRLGGFFYVFIVTGGFPKVRLHDFP